MSWATTEWSYTRTSQWAYHNIHRLLRIAYHNEYFITSRNFEWAGPQQNEITQELNFDRLLHRMKFHKPRNFIATTECLLHRDYSIAWLQRMKSHKPETLRMSRATTNEVTQERETSNEPSHNRMKLHKNEKPRMSRATTEWSYTRTRNFEWAEPQQNEVTQERETSNEPSHNRMKLHKNEKLRMGWATTEWSYTKTRNFEWAEPQQNEVTQEWETSMTWASQQIEVTQERETSNEPSHNRMKLHKNEKLRMSWATTEWSYTRTRNFESLSHNRMKLHKNETYFIAYFNAWSYTRMRLLRIAEPHQNDLHKNHLLRMSWATTEWSSSRMRHFAYWATTEWSYTRMTLRMSWATTEWSYTRTRNFEWAEPQQNEVTQELRHFESPTSSEWLHHLLHRLPHQPKLHKNEKLRMTWLHQNDFTPTEPTSWVEPTSSNEGNHTCIAYS